MTSKYVGVNEQKQKENEAKLRCEFESLHRRSKTGDYTEKCPICHFDQLIMVLNKEKGIANCNRCKVGVKVNF